MGQSSNKGRGDARAQASSAPACRVSLETATRRSSNAALTASRYHYTSDKSSKTLTADYEISDEVLGKGLCGSVVLAYRKVDRRRCALKTIRKQYVDRAKLKQLIAEVEIYLTLDHPHIARLHDVYETQAEVYLLTECCDGGELYARLQDRGVYTDADAAEATRHMLRAVSYLHSHHVVHRDLKLENFLYERETGDGLLKLIDFGLARIWDPSTPMMASCGSISYVSPDVLSGRGYTSKCDLWSLGVIVWMLLVGYPPFHGSKQSMMEKIQTGQADWSYKDQWKLVSAEAVDFLRQLITQDPEKRPDAQAALQHRWLTKEGGASAPARLGNDLLRSLQRYAESSRIRRAVLQLLAQELLPDETRELRDIFLAIDRSNEGMVSLRDLKNAIRGDSESSLHGRQRLSADSIDSFGSQSTPATPVRRLQRANSFVLNDLFKLLDANGDDRIYYLDFLAATMEARTQNREETIRAAFYRLDADGSGTISVEDFTNVIGQTFEGVHVEELVAEADPSGSGEISFDRFVRMLEDRDATPSSAHALAPAWLPPAASPPDGEPPEFFLEETGGGT